MKAWGMLSDSAKEQMIEKPQEEKVYWWETKADENRYLTSST